MLLLRGATRLPPQRLSVEKFQYMLLLRGATQWIKNLNGKPTFQYMLLLRGATRFPLAIFILRERFNTCSSCEEQQRRFQKPFFPSLFQYMLLLRGATLRFFVKLCKLPCFNTCSSCEEQRRVRRFRCRTYRFNTCSSCEEQLVRGVWSSNRSVSIHAPLARSNKNSPFRMVKSLSFQYMLLLRGATCNGDNCALCK